MNKYSIVINSDNFSHTFGIFETLKEARRLASEIVKIGCFWLESVRLSESEIKGITINIYKDDKVYFSKTLRKSYQKYLISLNKKNYGG